jgi:hypothetical protein
LHLWRAGAAVDEDAGRDEEGQGAEGEGEAEGCHQARVDGDGGALHGHDVHVGVLLRAERGLTPSFSEARRNWEPTAPPVGDT